MSEKIFEKLSTAILEGDSDASASITQQGLDEGVSAADLLNNGLIVGMNEVGVRFKAGDMFVPEVLMSAEAMTSGMNLLRVLLAESDTKMAGKIVMGTVEGDLHDIGKNLVSMMCEGAGFQIVNLGFDVAPDKFIEAIKEHQPEIVGMSAMLTTTMRAMGHTIKAIEEAGLRDKVKVMVGGAPVDQEFADRIGADGYGANAPSSSELAKQLVGLS
ncbi:MAG TPA: cobalamin-binding protein [Chloroflexi bacterium]|nr:MAG: cobalamin-binding protein [Chloroflexota bacterium]HDD54747.1 cobalamin-binding protein [Chloroflexota bacterium]